MGSPSTTLGGWSAAHHQLFVFSPAATRHVALRDLAADARTIVPVVIRDTAEGVVVELPITEPEAEPTIEAAIRDMRLRLTHELDRLPITSAPVARRARADGLRRW